MEVWKNGSMEVMMKIGLHEFIICFALGVKL